MKNTRFTVANLMELESMTGSEVISGANGLWKPVSMLNIMEVPDIIDWVQPGDFLLTTAYSFKDHEEGLTHLIHALIEKNIAGFGIKMKRYVDKIPQEALDKAEKHEFPIIEIPYDVSFSSILIEGYTQIINNQMSTLIRIDTLHRKFISIMLGGGKLNDITESLYSSFEKNPIGLKDYAFDTSIIFSGDSDREFIVQALDKERFKRSEKRMDNSENNHVVRVTDDWDGVHVNRIEIPISSGNVEYGRLFIWETKKQLTPVEISVMESSTSLIALEIYKNLSVFESQTSQMTEFVEGLLSGQRDQYIENLKRSNFFNFHPQEAHAVLIISFEDTSSRGKDKPMIRSDEEAKQRHLGLIHRINSLREWSILVASKENQLILIMEIQQDTEKKAVRKKLQDFSDALESYFSNPRNYEPHITTIGRVYYDSMDLWNSYREAQQAYQYALQSEVSSPIFFEDMGVYRILTNEGIQQEMNYIRNDALEALIAYDTHKKSDLVDTLREYFTCQGNLVKVAERQFIHYNTVVYRIGRIKEIAGIDFEDYDQCLTLQLALKIHDMEMKKKDNS